MSVMENILQAQPKIDAVFAHNDEMALGAIKAIKAAKRQNEYFQELFFGKRTNQEDRADTST